MANNIWRDCPSSRLTAFALVKHDGSEVTYLVADDFWEAATTDVLSNRLQRIEQGIVAVTAAGMGGVILE